MGKLFQEYLEGNNIFVCTTCQVHLTSYNELISKVNFLIRIICSLSSWFWKEWLMKLFYFIRLSKEDMEKHTYLIQCKFRGLSIILSNSYSVNITCGPKEERILLSGKHIVSDILCKKCHTVLGWKYVYFF